MMVLVVTIDNVGNVFHIFA